MARVVALMDSMWQGYGGQGPRWFRINPHNFSGRRLYALVGRHAGLLVTNCCREMQLSARHHGQPDIQWVADNLQRVAPIEVLLICGRVAQATYAALPCKPAACHVILMKHPAARTWTKKELEIMRRKIARCLALKPTT